MASRCCCLFVLPLFPLLLAYSLPSPPCNLPAQLNSLVSIFSSSTTPLHNWSTSLHYCEWEGIGCDSHACVTRLWLPSRGLRGTLSPSITNLSTLTHLNLSQNTLTGFLPAHLFSSLNNLKVLDLSNNLFQGELPLSSPLFSSRHQRLPTSIEVVDLSSNRLKGSLPSSFFNDAKKLSHFNVSHNVFTGTIPTSLCEGSSSLLALDVSINGFTGEIPLDGCVKLQVLQMASNNFSGTIPDEIYYIQTLRELNMASNQLHGSILNGIGNLTALTALELQGNELSGELPRGMGRLSKLEKLVLYRNNLKGSISVIMNCTGIIEMNLRYNQFDGDMSNLDFSKLSKLRIIDLGSNLFEGEYPMSLYSCKSLRAIRLAYNKLRGEISPDIRNLQSLAFIALSSNSLTNISGAIKILMGCNNLEILILAVNFMGEAIPHDIDIRSCSHCFRNLRYFSLRHCDLRGQVPSWLSMVKNLQVLRLNDNKLGGPLPGWLGSLPNLFHMDLSQNLITGEIPPALLSGLKALTSDFPLVAKSDWAPDLSIFLTYGVVDPQTRQYRQLSDLPRAIILSNNSLYGRIPPEIGSLRYIQWLEVGINHLSGQIPDGISRLSNLEILNLSSNHLTGRIPESLAGLNFLRELDVSFNDLEGPVPKGTQLQSFGNSAYEGNRRLCGAPLPDPCRGAHQPKAAEEGDGGGRGWFSYIGMGAGFITGFFSVCVTLLVRNLRNV